MRVACSCGRKIEKKKEEEQEKNNEAKIEYFKSRLQNLSEITTGESRQNHSRLRWNSNCVRRPKQCNNIKYKLPTAQPDFRIRNDSSKTNSTYNTHPAIAKSM